jgi:polygalacturonase
VEWKDFKRLGGTVSEKGDLWYPFNLKGFDNIAATPQEQEKMRTHLIRFTASVDILVKGVTVQNSPKFHIVSQNCANVIIDGVTVRCPWNAQNGDGIDIMQCQDVLITGCRVDVGDDGICLKAGAGEAALKYGPCQNILIQDNTVYHGHGGFVIGSEFSAGMKDIVVRRNTFSGTDTGLRFKSGPGRGGKTSNIVISDIYMSDIRDEAIVFETGYVNVAVGDAPAEAAGPSGRDFLPEFTGIRISRVVCNGARIAAATRGPISSIHGIILENSILQYTEKGLELEDPASLEVSQDVVVVPFLGR